MKLFIIDICSGSGYTSAIFTEAIVWRYSVGKGVLKSFIKFTGKQLCKSLFSNKVAGLRPETLSKKRLWHRCFPVNFAKLLRTTFFYSTPLVAACVFKSFCYRKWTHFTFVLIVTPVVWVATDLQACYLVNIFSKVACGLNPVKKGEKIDWVNEERIRSWLKIHKPFRKCI